MTIWRDLGVRVGHWTDGRAMTGCTVVLLPEGNTTSGEVRGGAPGTREFALLDPSRLVTQVDAVVLSGGSAFGLAACDGVARWLAERGRGFSTAAGPVPIVVGMVLFDLMVGDGSVRPDARSGHDACEAASEDDAVGPVGAGAGLMYGKWLGREHGKPAGLGLGVERLGDLTVAALVAVNALGDITADAPAERPRPPVGAAGLATPFPPLANTTVGVIATNARLHKLGAHLVAQAAHDGLARAVEPAHTMGDGDAFVATSVGDVDAPIDHARLLAARAVEAAIRSVAAR